MRTDMTATLASTRLRAVVTIQAMDEMLGGRPWEEFMRALLLGDPRAVRAVLRACVKAAGDLKPAAALSEVDRLMEEAGIAPCAEFAQDLMQHAIDKAETARKNSQAAAPQAVGEAASEEMSPSASRGSTKWEGRSGGRHRKSAPQG